MTRLPFHVGLAEIVGWACPAISLGALVWVAAVALHGRRQP